MSVADRNRGSAQPAADAAARLRGRRAGTDRPARRPSVMQAAPLFLILLVLAMAMPGFLPIGPLVITPSRFYLMLTTIPALIALFMTVRMRRHDWLYVFFVLWTILCIGINYGPGKALEGGGSFLLETLGVYALVQVSLRRPEQVLSLINLLFWVVAILLPFAVYEALTGHRLVAELFSKIISTRVDIQGDKRLGLYRAAVSFPHPILFGIFCASVFSFVWYRATGMLVRLVRSGIVGLATFFSLSAGALLPIVLQLLMIGGERFSRSVRNRGMVVFWVLLALYVFLEIASNRGPFGLMASYLTFNPSTAWYRINIWNNGIDDVMRNPIFGMRIEDWERPAWMPSSIDNFWLVQLMRGGFPATIALGLSIVLMLRQLMTPADAALSDPQRRLRRASLFSLIALCLAAGTVDLFGNLLPIFAFYVGIAAALARMEPEGDPLAEDGPPRRIRRKSGWADQPGPRRGGSGSPSSPPTASSSSERAARGSASPVPRRRR